MPDHKLGSSHSFANLMAAFHADQQTDEDTHFLLFRGDAILALCLRHKFNPIPAEVWVGDAPEVARWGERLAALKNKQTVPVYYSRPGRKLFEFRGHHLITDETIDPKELAQRKSPVQLSRIVFLKQIQQRPAS